MEQAESCDGGGIQTQQAREHNWTWTPKSLELSAFGNVGVETDVRNASGFFNTICEVTGFRKASYAIVLPSCADVLNEA